MARMYLVNIDLGGHQILNMLLQVLATDPVSPAEGQVWYNSTSHTVRWYNGAATVVLGTLDQISAPAADVGMASHKITSLADPTNPQDAATRAYVLARSLSDFAGPSGDLAIGSHKLTGVTDPASAQDAATKHYVDGLVQGLTWKNAVRAATTTPGTLATDFANGSVLDTVTLVTGDRILIKNQAAPADNGIYVVAASGAPTRSDDAATGAELVNAAVFVEEGSTQSDTAWVVTTSGPISLGSTSIAIAQFGAGSTYVQGTGIVITGNSVALDIPVSVAHGGTGAITAPLALAALGAPGKYAASIGDTTSVQFDLTHGLAATKDLIVQVFRVASPYDQIECDVQHLSTTQVRLIFATAPGSSEYRVVIIG